LYPDLWKMIEFLKKRNVRIGLTSNGTLITREIARRLVEAGVDIRVACKRFLFAGVVQCSPST